MSDRTAYLAAEGYVEELAHELGRAERRHGRLLIAAGPPRLAAWAANVWLDPQEIEIASISDAAAKLRAVQRNWAGYTPHLHRRATLIQEQLPKVSSKPLVFGAPPPAAPLGSWTLLDPGTMLATARSTSPFPHGEVLFVEDRIGPPSRAYLKLWEALTLLECRPAAGRNLPRSRQQSGRLELGAAADGCAGDQRRQGAARPEIVRLPRIEHRLESAFALDPRKVGPVDWLFSDVVCYPARLLELVERWLAAGTCRRFVCTIKFQGETDHEAARRFAAIPGSQLRHLFHNKHELTWIKIA